MSFGEGGKSGCKSEENMVKRKVGKPKSRNSRMVIDRDVGLLERSYMFRYDLVGTFKY